MEQQSWEVVTTAFYLHGALGTVEINIDTDGHFFTMLSLPPETHILLTRD